MKLENRELEPPFKPNIPEKDYTKFFNAEQGIDETVLKRKERNIVIKNQGLFDNFNSKKIKK